MTRLMLDQTKAIEDQTRQALHKQRQKGRFKLKSVLIYYLIENHPIKIILSFFYM